MKLTSTNLESVLLSCLFKDGEDTTTHIKGEGVMIRIGFHPERLESQKENIKSMLTQLPIEFQRSGGGGWSFLNACNDCNGEQWADLHETIDKLVALGIASKQLEFLMPREIWSALPGGMPYMVVNN